MIMGTLFRRMVSAQRIISSPNRRFWLQGAYIESHSTSTATDEWWPEYFFRRIVDTKLRASYQNTLTQEGFIPLPVELIDSSCEDFEMIEIFILKFVEWYASP